MLWRLCRHVPRCVNWGFKADSWSQSTGLAIDINSSQHQATFPTPSLTLLVKAIVLQFWWHQRLLFSTILHCEAVFYLLICLHFRPSQHIGFFPKKSWVTSWMKEARKNYWKRSSAAAALPIPKVIVLLYILLKSLYRFQYGSWIASNSENVKVT